MDTEEYRRLKALYLKEFDKLHELAEEFYGLAKPSIPDCDETSETHAFIQRHLALRFAACASGLASYSPEPFPNNKELLLREVVHRLIERKKNSEELLEHIRSEKEQLLKTKAELQSKLTAEAAIRKVVSDKYNSYPQHGSAGSDRGATSADSRTKFFKETETKLKKLKKLKEIRLQQLSDFLDNHFPPPERPELLGPDIFEFGENRPSQSLACLIQLLVSVHLKNPEQWINIDDSMVPKYLELLLRTGIAIRNPNNSSQIRLENFNN